LKKQDERTATGALSAKRIQYWFVARPDGLDSSQRLSSWFSLESAMVKRTRNVAKEVEQDFPHFVDIAVPLGGLGSKLAAMYDFHARHRISPKRGHGRRDDKGGAIRWCFADPQLADAFAQEFARE
jgi:hypothetical protein